MQPVLNFSKRKEGFHGEQALFLPYVIIAQMENDPITSPLHITMIGYYPRARNHYRERPETIAQYVLIYCVEGTGWLSVNNEEYKIHQNEYIILPANTPHAYGSDDENSWTIYWVHFKGSMADYLAQGLHKPTEIKPTSSSRINERIRLFEEIFRTLQNGYSKPNLHFATTVFYYFLGSIRYLEQYCNVLILKPDQTDLINTAIYYMHENIEKKLTLQDIAQYIGYSPPYFSKIFTEKIGYNPTTYLNQIKIQRACQLLDFTKMKVNQICYKIGIDDSYYFSRLFKKVMGMSPREYRNQVKG